MPNAFVLKLRNGANLTETDEGALSDLLRPERYAEARRDTTLQNVDSGALPVLLEGWACRYRVLENGKRQILSLLLPGDLCEPFGLLPRFSVSTISAITPVRYAMVSPDSLRKATRDNERIEEALWWDLLISTSIERELIVSLGRRTAAQRLGHLFCELCFRMSWAGMTDGKNYDLPLTQTEMGDLLGLSAVHANRSLQRLRRGGYISLQGRRLSIMDLDGLMEQSDFDPAYLNRDTTQTAKLRA